MRKSQHREVKQLNQGHTGGKRWPGILRGHNTGTEPWKLGRNLPNGHKKGGGGSIPDTGNCKYQCLKIIRNFQVHPHVGCWWESYRSPGLKRGSGGLGQRQNPCALQRLKECKHKLQGFLVISIRIFIRIKLANILQEQSDMGYIFLLVIAFQLHYNQREQLDCPGFCCLWVTQLRFKTREF